MDLQKPEAMIETTDALEAVGVCQSMKNFLFVVILLAMVICQLIFWMEWLGLIDKNTCGGCKPAAACPACPVVPQICPNKPQADAVTASSIPLPVYLAATVEGEPTAAAEPAEKSIETSVEEVIEAANVTAEEKEILLENAADKIPAEIPTEHASPEMLVPQGASGEPTAETKDDLSLLRISCRFARTLTAICNFLILVGTVLYCLTLLVCLKISLAGRLGGLNHIARSFFLSLFLLMVVIPWQQILPGVLIGSVWLPKELLCGGWAQASESILWKVLFYLRFCGLWFIGFWLLLWTQTRSAKWARATLRRLGVVR